MSSLGDSTCMPLSSLPSAGGIACRTPQGGVGVIDWTGKITIFATGDVFTGGASVAPDGNHIAASGQGAILKLISSPATGSTESDIGGGYPEDGGWLDADRVVVRGAGTPSQSVIDVVNRSITALPQEDVFTARLPGGF